MTTKCNMRSRSWEGKGVFAMKNSIGTTDEFLMWAQVLGNSIMSVLNFPNLIIR